MTSRLICFIWGHGVDNRVFLAEGRACTRCGTTLLRDDPAPVRIGHTLSCFLSHHTYEPVGARDGHLEYACVRCGHPLLFPSTPTRTASGTGSRNVSVTRVASSDITCTGWASATAASSTPATAGTASSISRTGGRWSGIRSRACCWVTGCRLSGHEA